jgi:hypothetical protein
VSGEENQAGIPKLLNKVVISNSGGFDQHVFTNEARDMKQAHQSWKIRDPGYRMRYFNLRHCRRYLQTHFHPVFLRAFDRLGPYAFKADFSRYLVLYREGGWYSDWKQVCLVNNTLEALSSAAATTSTITTWVSFTDGGMPKKLKCYVNAFFGSTPRHPVLASMIRRILINIQTKHNGRTSVHLTGSCLLGSHVHQLLGYAKDGVNGARVGEFSISRGQRFIYNDTVMVQHKTWSGRQKYGLWANMDGNSYGQMYQANMSYCPDSATIFQTHHY